MDVLAKGRVAWVALLVWGAALILGAGSAHAAPVTAHDARTVAAALQDNGFQAKLDKTEDGDPMILSGSGGNRFALIFSSCTAHADCSFIEMVAFWTGVEPAMGSKLTTAWNSEENFSGVLYFPDRRQVSLYHYLITGKDGISAESLVESVGYFMEDFANIGDKLAKQD
jgi:hypothetical protein